MKIHSYEKNLPKIDVKQKVILDSKGSKTCHFVIISMPFYHHSNVFYGAKCQALMGTRSTQLAFLAFEGQPISHS